MHSSRHSEKVAAGIRAAAASFRTNRTVFHLLRVGCTLSSTDLAGGDTRTEQVAVELLVRRGDPGDHLGCGEADIRTVQIIADAGDHALNVLFAKARIRTRIACLMTCVACRDAFDRFAVIRFWVNRMGFEHLFNVAHGGILRLTFASSVRGMRQHRAHRCEMTKFE